MSQAFCGFRFFAAIRQTAPFQGPLGTPRLKSIIATYRLIVCTKFVILWLSSWHVLLLEIAFVSQKLLQIRWRGFCKPSLFVSGQESFCQVFKIGE